MGHGDYAGPGMAGEAIKEAGCMCIYFHVSW